MRNNLPNSGYTGPPVMNKAASSPSLSSSRICTAAAEAVSKRGRSWSIVPMLAELSRIMAAAEFAPPQSELRLVTVGLASPAAIKNKTAARKTINKMSWMRFLRRVFSALTCKNRKVLKGKFFARCRLIMCSTTGMAAARAASRNNGAAKDMGQGLGIRD